jgi:xylulokinase
MLKPALLTIDIGTSSFKSALWNEDVFQPESGSRPPQGDSPKDGNRPKDGSRLSFAGVPLSGISGGVKNEADPSLWLSAFEESCRLLLSNLQIDNLKGVEAVVISGNGPTLAPVLGEPVFDKFRVPSANARLWLDRRAVKYQDEVSSLMGGFVDAGFFLPKILSLKDDENELYQKTKYFLGCPEYLAFALTGNARSVFPCEGFDRWFWNDDVLEKLKLDADKFPPFIRPADSFGTIHPQAASRFGFSKDVPVISGGPDFFAAILGSGVTEPRQACDRTGSSEGINLCTQTRVNDQRLMSYAHPVKPYWNLSGVINTTGRAVEWACDLLGVNNFNDFISLAQKSESGSGGLIFHPFLAGERAPAGNPAANALWSGINLNTGRSQFANSVLEGIGFAIRDVISVMEGSGVKVKQLRVTGGLSGCSFLNRIKADITGIEIIEGAHKEAELLGLAIIGGCYLGKFSSYAEASSALYRVEKSYEPNTKNTALYNQLFSEYKSIRDKYL